MKPNHNKAKPPVTLYGKEMDTSLTEGQTNVLLIILKTMSSFSGCFLDWQTALWDTKRIQE